MELRLQKFISQAGIASRRRAEELIAAGKVRVNGKIIREMGTKVDLTKDLVEIDGKKIEAQKMIYLIMNKPVHILTTRHDPQNRRTVYDLIPNELRNVIWPVGRLDFDTEGLLILTNDGELTQDLAHPSAEHEKEYEVVLDKPLSIGRTKKLSEGMIIDGKKTAGAKIKTRGSTVYITISEGRNRQIRKMFSAFGYKISSLKRIRIGKLELNGLQLGKYQFISKDRII
jgi:23S rRNA pseudouridine2605 synthase